MLLEIGLASGGCTLLRLAPTLPFCDCIYISKSSNRHYQPTSLNAQQVFHLGGQVKLARVLAELEFFLELAKFNIDASLVSIVFIVLLICQS